MDRNLLIGSYENKRFLFLSTFLLHRPNWIDPALAFAYYQRVQPIFHQDNAMNDYGYDDIYAPIYPVKEDYIWKVVSHLNTNACKGNVEELRFPRLDALFAGNSADSRGWLASAIRYSILSQRVEVRAVPHLKDDSREWVYWTRDLARPFTAEEVTTLE